MSSTLEPVLVNIGSDLLQKLDNLAKDTNSSKSSLIQEAVEYYLEEIADLDSALEILHSTNSEYLDWELAKDELLNKD